MDNWAFEIWDAGNVNNEWQKYVENTDNYMVENGIISNTVTETGKNKKEAIYLPVYQVKIKKIKYGRIEFREKMPNGNDT